MPHPTTTICQGKANRLHIDGDNLVITPRGMNKLWGFRSALSIPLRHIRGATADDSIAADKRGLRAPGLSIPGKYVGTFHRDGEKMYWNVHRGEQTLVLQLKEEQFDRIVLSIPDAKSTERRLNAALNPAVEA
ncbi:hypothetical protein [Corynebacterium heidelbergense]|uniref:Bacterial Pleckstrin homology domain-containing protein n=1 Tax=Corynebacterium heidelbergense TaxID=2055947 RepID=A0A364V874_9CORY|nr:hypothetical protein [Corynebacterium heidelbergense]RAV32852.1 hypothetical protein DLJ54_01305 [Corynebacterium heidelbergense]